MNDWHQVVGTMGGLIAFFSIIPYIKDILHGTTRPNVVSYILWCILLSISVFAQYSSGASWTILLVGADLAAALMVILFCFTGYGYKKYGPLEIICFTLAIIAIVLWQVTNNPLLAIIFSLIADILAGIPTIVKTYRDPKSELPLGWFMVAFGALLSLISNTIFDLPNLLFPVWILIVNTLIGFLALRRVSK
ncbi:MAG: hypothetical protein JWP09_252 [Candidatus Taylorbacteria bacterium]|nr:hypothetical protein [Candidatus Taylorbacteria bacterium]